MKSPLAWGRGSKLQTDAPMVSRSTSPVAPRVGAWIETFRGLMWLRCSMSRSPLAWGRGSKHPQGAFYMWAVGGEVAPRVGAWIETLHARYDEEASE